MSFGDEAQELFEERLKAFAAWTAKRWLLGDEVTDLTEEERSGWNSCCESISDALTEWLAQDSPTP